MFPKLDKQLDGFWMRLWYVSVILNGETIINSCLEYRSFENGGISKWMINQSGFDDLYIHTHAYSTIQQMGS